MAADGLDGQLQEASSTLSRMSAAEVLRFVDEKLGDRAVMASSFGVEDMVLLDLATKNWPRVKVFTLDTGRLHPQTYEVMDTVRSRYGVTVETYFPDRRAVEELETKKGFYSFRNSVDERKECCAIRKVEPLRRALAGRSAWVTGLRRGQSVTRSSVETIEYDAGNGLWKFNPLANWDASQVWAYVKEHNVPYNRLHDEGYPSIGCAPCTRAVKPYEDERAGRWWWESAEHKECGLHRPR